MLLPTVPPTGPHLKTDTANAMDLMTLGTSLPPGDPHGVSVSLPRWEDTVGWANRDKKVLERMTTGYPRFFVPLIVRQLAAKIIHVTLSGSHENLDTPFSRDDAEELDALLVPTWFMSVQCREYLQSHAPDEDFCTVAFRMEGVCSAEDYHEISGNGTAQIYAVIFRGSIGEGEPKAFWQHTGFGISSRCASYWLSNALCLKESRRIPDELPRGTGLRGAHSEIRKRIASLLCSPATRIDEHDVRLFHTGMSAITHSAYLHSTSPDSIVGVAVFGFLYVDTFKVLSRLRRYKCTLYDNSDAELDRLEDDLKKEPTRYKALYIEFPGNPLLGSPDLVRIHRLARQYRFAVVLDDTIATSVNLDLLPYADIICTSLTKMFSGGCNAMGGSIVINPKSPHHHVFSSRLATFRIDSYFPSDVLVMAANSSDFATRVRAANRSASLIATKLRTHPKVLNVFYPEGSASQRYYDQHKRAEQGYGFLLSIKFVSPSSAIAFYDSLAVAKGPSLGTNFTLSCAYTLLAHAKELEWAAEYGVTEHLVRISVGIEKTSELIAIVDRALTVVALLEK